MTLAIVIAAIVGWIFISSLLVATACVLSSRLSHSGYCVRKPTVPTNEAQLDGSTKESEIPSVSISIN